MEYALLLKSGDHLQTSIKLGEKIFSVEGNQGDYWLAAHVNITATTRYFVVIEGVVGSGAEGKKSLNLFSILHR